MINKNYFRNTSLWDIFSEFILISLSILQIARWAILPQDMDIHYHLLSAWGFVHAGGYSGWDFWQYAPFGRINIYPPFFQIILALFMKAGANPIILAKLFEITIPIIFLIVLWRFIRNNYGQKLAFFSLVILSSSYDFFQFLINHAPLTLSLIFGILGVSQIFKQKIIRSAILLILCFYTHIGVSWFFILALSIYLQLDKQYRKFVSASLLLALIFYTPILIKLISAAWSVSLVGLNIEQITICQVKIIEYFLAFGGLYLVFKAKGKYYLFASFFLSALIFLVYPYRFFSGEGYLPIIFLSAVFLLSLWDKCKSRIFPRVAFISAVLIIAFISPTLSFSRQDKAGVSGSLTFIRSGLTGVLLSQGSTMWHSAEYSLAANLIRTNSEERDIIYCNLDYFGLVLGGISGRATANALLPEVRASQDFRPISTSRIVVLTKDTELPFLDKLTKDYNLRKIGETKWFNIYKNPSTLLKTRIVKASIPFWLIFLIALVAIYVFVKS